MKIVIWSKENCSHCKTTKLFLEQKNLPYEERVIGRDVSKIDLLEVVPDAKTVPQVFIDDDLVGGYQDLVQYFRNAE